MSVPQIAQDSIMNSTLIGNTFKDPMLRPGHGKIVIAEPIIVSFGTRNEQSSVLVSNRHVLAHIFWEDRTET
jgi:hypothetical protein